MPNPPTLIEDELEIVSKIAGKSSQQSVLDVSSVADPTLEYISQDWWGHVNQALVLPPWIDDLTRDLGGEQFGGTSIYTQMKAEPIVSASVGALMANVFSQRVKLSPPVDSEDSSYKKALKISDFCQRNLDELRRPFHGLFYESIEGAIYHGHKVTEKIYAVQSDPDIGKCLRLVDLKAKPQNSTAFVVDQYRNVLGLMYKPLGQLQMFQSVPINADGKVTGLIPRSKCFVPTYLPQNADPRGQSALRAAYHAWWMLQQIYESLKRYIAIYGTPPIVSYLAQNSVDQTRDPATNALLATPIRASYVQNNALKALRAGGIATLPYGAKTDVLQATGDGMLYIHAIATQETRVARAILYTSRILVDSTRGGSQGDSETAQDVLGMRAIFVKIWAEDTLRNEVLKDLVRYNFGEKYLPLTPTVNIGQTEQHDFPLVANAISALQQSGALQLDMLPKIFADMNLPNSEILAKKIDALNQQDFSALPIPVSPVSGEPPAMAEKDTGNDGQAMRAGVDKGVTKNAAGQRVPTQSGQAGGYKPPTKR